MHHITHLLIAIALLGAVSCQTKPQLPSQLYTTVHLVADLDLVAGLQMPTVWFVWIDSTNPSVPR